MTLTVSQAGQHIRHALLAKPAVEINVRALINETGEWMAAMHPWKWLERGSAALLLRGVTSVGSGATYAHATRQITSVGSFGSYRFQSGDEFRVTTVGTLVGVGRRETFAIEKRVSADVIQLASPGLGQSAADSNDNDANASFAGEVPVPFAALPSDFMELIAYDATDALVNTLELTTFQHLLELRTNQILTAPWNFYGAVEYFEDAIDNNRVKPRLALWPDPAAGTNETLTIFYRSTWPRVEQDSEEVRIPSWMEPCFIHCLRAYCKGYEQDADGEISMDQRLLEVLMGPVWRAAIERDGKIQPDYGMMRGGAVQEMPQGTNRFLRTTVSGPS